MRLVSLSISMFRGIRSLEWNPGPGLMFLVGPGDSAKTTILDAIELALLPRTWVQFYESDFFDGSTDEPIEICVTMVDVPAGLLTSQKFGLQQRGWSEDGVLHDEPEDDDAPALSVRLRVDASLEPAWHVVNDREPDGRAISARDRETLGAVRLEDEAEREFSWTRGSSLTRVTDDPESISTVLAEAHRRARAAVRDVDFDSLSATAREAGDLGAELGAHIALPLGIGIDPRRLNVGGGALGLEQAGGIPARSLGLGSRRLLALGIQRQALATGVVTLVDEVEHGLEPHRLRQLVRELRAWDRQVLATSHSPVAIAELGVDGLGIVRRDATGVVQVIHPDVSLQGVIRALPEAILSRRLIVCEGATEYGIARGLVAKWDETRAQPLAAVGTVFVDGGGSYAPGRAMALRALGFECGYWADSDRLVSPSIEELRAAGITTIVWADSHDTEHRIMADVPEQALENLWEIAASEKGLGPISDQMAAAAKWTGTPPESWAEWLSAMSVDNLRVALGDAASSAGWYKTVSAGERLGTVVADVLDKVDGTDLGEKLGSLRILAYRD